MSTTDKNAVVPTPVTEAEQVVEATKVLLEFPLQDLATNVQNTRFEAQAAEEVVNPIVLAELLGCRPQMIYNYIRKGKIQAVQHNNTQKLVITLDEAQRFANEYLTRKAMKAIKVKEELAALEAETAAAE
jgi:uncharacterized membrane protein